MSSIYVINVYGTVYFSIAGCFALNTRKLLEQMASFWHLFGITSVLVEMPMQRQVLLCQPV